jgi:flavin reductase (DIM6/NTAB) family NADH-FMN oxidoreductase RutF
MTILTLPLPRPAIDQQTFQDAAAHLACAVAVVAWGTDAPRGLVVDAVNVLSTEPARLLFGVAKINAEHDGLLLTQECSLTLLTSAEEDEAETFGRPDRAARRFSSDRWRLSQDRPPEFMGGLVRFSGFIDQKIDAGSHSLFVIRVGVAAVHDAPPLLYFDRSFRRLQPRPGAAAQVAAVLEA